MPASSRTAVTRATKPRPPRRSPAAAPSTAAPPRAPARRRSAQIRALTARRRSRPGRGHEVGRQRRGDDVAGVERRRRWWSSLRAPGGEQRDVGAEDGVHLVLDDPQLGSCAGRRHRLDRSRPRDPAALERQRRVGASASPSTRPHQGSSSARSDSSVRPGLFLYFRVRPSRNSATVAGWGYTSTARRARRERGFRSRPSAATTAAPRGVPVNSGLAVFDGCAPASKRAKSWLSAASAGRLPVAFLTISGRVEGDQALALVNGA